DLLGFLADRVVSLEESLDGDDASEPQKLQRELEMTSDLIDRVLYLYHELSDQEIEYVETAQASS
ncbi:MAG: hypothetical protein R3253_10555, partial [Longimicrobiales bacterium]|nr:hypothetical protein [Longimicrobiales bacterium]